MTDEVSSPRAWQRHLQFMPASRIGAWLFSNRLHYIDRLLLRLSKGRLSVPGVLVGLPVVTLTTTGAKSGKSRTAPVVGIRDGDKIVIIGTNFGTSRQPAWYHNLRANPEAILTLPQASGTYIAREATPAERELYWKKGDEIYIGYAAYRRRIRGREVPIFVLTPKRGELGRVVSSRHFGAG